MVFPAQAPPVVCNPQGQTSGGRSKTVPYSSFLGVCNPGDDLRQAVILTLPFLCSGISVTILETFQPQPAPPGSARGNVRCFPSSSIQPLKQTSAEGHEQLRPGPPWPSKPASFDFNNAHLASSLAGWPFRGAAMKSRGRICSIDWIDQCSRKQARPCWQWR